MPPYDADYVPRSAMGIYAHPDDAEFTVAGTVAKWAAAGCEVTYVLVTSGNVGTHEGGYTRETLEQLREEEERAAARVLGVRNLVFLRHDDCAVIPTIELRRELVREIRKHRPEVVLCADPRAWFFEDRYVNHPDHRAAGVAALEAAFPCAEMELLWPEEGTPHAVQAIYVSSTLEPNTWIDITATMETKIAALKAHASQVGGGDYSDMIRSWGRDAARAAEAAGKGRRTRKGTAEATGGKGAGPTRFAEAFRVMRIRQRG